MISKLLGREANLRDIKIIIKYPRIGAQLPYEHSCLFIDWLVGPAGVGWLMRSFVGPLYVGLSIGWSVNIS